MPILNRPSSAGQSSPIGVRPSLDSEGPPDHPPHRLNYRFDAIPRDPRLDEGLRSGRLKPIDLTVLRELLNFRKRTRDSCWCTKETIAGRIGRCPKTVQRSFHRLQAAGLILQIPVETPDPDEPQNRTGWRIVFLWIADPARREQLGSGPDRRPPGLRRAADQGGGPECPPPLGTPVSSKEDVVVGPEGNYPDPPCPPIQQRQRPEPVVTPTPGATPPDPTPPTSEIAEPNSVVGKYPPNQSLLRTLIAARVDRPEDPGRPAPGRRRIHSWSTPPELEARALAEGDRAAMAERRSRAEGKRPPGPPPEGSPLPDLIRFLPLLPLGPYQVQRCVRELIETLGDHEGSWPCLLRWCEEVARRDWPPENLISPLRAATAEGVENRAAYFARCVKRWRFEHPECGPDSGGGFHTSGN